MFRYSLGCWQTVEIPYGRCFVIETDYKPLVYLNTARFKNSRITVFIQQFKFHTRSIIGLNNLGADIISRCPLE